MKVQISIEFNTLEDAGQWYEKDQNVIAANKRSLLTAIEFSELRHTMKHLKETYNVTDIHLHFDETNF